MYCTQCGVQIDDNVNYCNHCGAATANAPRVPRRPLTRAREDAKVAGVCAGVARYFGLDVTLVRVLWALLSIWPPLVGIVAYIVCWIVIPRDPIALPAAREAVKTT